MDVIQSEAYRRWMNGLKDKRSVQRINARILQIQSVGRLVGDYKHVGKGVYELRYFFGPGFRVYVSIENDNTLLLLLIGGDKSSQTRDIDKAIELIGKWRRDNG